MANAHFAANGLNGGTRRRENASTSSLPIPRRRASPKLVPAQFEQAVLLIQTDGRVFSAAEAVLRTRALPTSRGWLLAAYERLPGFAPALEAIYRAIARSRPLLSWLPRVFFRPRLR